MSRPPPWRRAHVNDRPRTPPRRNPPPPPPPSRSRVDETPVLTRRRWSVENDERNANVRPRLTDDRPPLARRHWSVEADDKNAHVDERPPSTRRHWSVESDEKKARVDDRPPLTRRQRSSEKEEKNAHVDDRPPLTRRQRPIEKDENKAHVDDRPPLARKTQVDGRPPLPRRQRSVSVECDGDTSDTQNEYGVETMEIPDKEDIAFICGKGGSTVKRIALVSSCKIRLKNEMMAMEVEGLQPQRRRALQYAKFMIAQRKAKNKAVQLNKNDVEQNCTVVDIPISVMGYVVGIRGATLRKMEEEHSVIMFVCEMIGAENWNVYESICILGDRNHRRNAQLEIMSSVESQLPTHFLGPWREDGETFEPSCDRHGDWATSAIELIDEEIRFLKGSNSRTIKSLSRASGCVVNSVGEVVFLSGSESQRLLAKDYIHLTLSQIRPDFAARAAQLFVEERDDRSILEIPSKDIAYILGKGRDTMSLLESEFGVVMAFRQAIDFPSDEVESDLQRLAVFGPLRARKCAEVEVMSSVENNDPGTYTTQSEHCSDVMGVAIDRIPYEDKRDVGSIIGKDSVNLTRFSRASGAFVQFVGQVCHITGTFDERTLARDYINFHLESRGSQAQINVAGRLDVTIVDLRDGAYLAGPEVWKIENETGTCCMHAVDDQGVKKFFIFGAEEGDKDTAGGGSGRAKAEKMAIGVLRNMKKMNWSTENSHARSRSPWGRGASAGQSVRSQHSNKEWRPQHSNKEWRTRYWN